VAGAGGGTGGNNAVTTTAGIAASAVSGSAISLAFFPTGTTETFDAGNSNGDGGNSASYFNVLTSGVFFPAGGTSSVLLNASATLTRVADGIATDGIQGIICIIEVL
jgi:hypothetical protein